LSISHAKTFLIHHEVRVADDEEELIGDETDILKVAKIEDSGENKVLIILRRSMFFMSTRMKSRVKCLRTKCKWS